MIDGAKCHDSLVKRVKPILSFDENADYDCWKQQIKEKLIDLMGLDQVEENISPVDNFIIEEQVQMDGYTQIRFSFYSEVDCQVPCYLLVPDNIEGKLPVAIVLQGHNDMGFHSSIGHALNHDTLDYDTGRGKFAVQAVKQGYVALAIEQRGMGERRATNTFERRVSLSPKGGCYYEAVTALTLGRTLLAERVFDIKRAIDMLSYFDCCDTTKIIITGNSGGGTASYYASCLDERIKICAPSCGFCSYPESILKFYHCSCNYIPKAFKYFDMQDLSCLIAPRKLSIIAGKYDTAFLIDGVKDAFKTVEQIYANNFCKNDCALVIHENGHFWREDVVWAEIKRQATQLGW